MEIQKKREEKKLIVQIEGKIDSTTAPEFQEAITDLSNVEELLLDFEKVEYISSAGIGVILSAYKTMHRQGSIRIIHVNKVVYSALFITGFTDKMPIERNPEEA